MKTWTHRKGQRGSGVSEAFLDKIVLTNFNTINICSRTITRLKDCVKIRENFSKKYFKLIVLSLIFPRNHYTPVPWKPNAQKGVYTTPPLGWTVCLISVDIPILEPVHKMPHSEILFLFHSINISFSDHLCVYTVAFYSTLHCSLVPRPHST